MTKGSKNMISGTKEEKTVRIDAKIYDKIHVKAVLEGKKVKDVINAVLKKWAETNSHLDSQEIRDMGFTLDDKPKRAVKKTK